MDQESTLRILNFQKKVLSLNSLMYTKWGGEEGGYVKPKIIFAKCVSYKHTPFPGSSSPRWFQGCVLLSWGGRGGGKGGEGGGYLSAIHSVLLRKNKMLL